MAISRFWAEATQTKAFVVLGTDVLDSVWRQSKGPHLAFIFNVVISDNMCVSV